MEALHIKIESIEGNELIIRQGDAPELPPYSPPKPIRITGVISSVADWLGKRKEDVAQLKSHVLFDMEAGTLKLIVDETNAINTQIEGVLQLSEIYKTLGINVGGFVSPSTMGKTLKRLRYYFADEMEGMKVIAGLMNFNATITKTHANENDLTGNSKKLDMNILAESSLPNPFELKIPIFKGEENHVITCEFEFDSEKMQVSLVSPAAYKKVQDAMQTRIGLELDRITELSPEIPQIQTIKE